MDNGMIGKIEKAKRYAQEPHRIHFESLQVRIDGENNAHVVSLKDQEWSCDCDFFRSHRICTHTMTLTNHLLKDMVPIPESELPR